VLELGSVPLPPAQFTRHGGRMLSELSPREREVFDLVVRGYSNEGVSAHLSISVKTVETHRAHINKKLQLHSTAELVRFAARHGLISYS
jgi:DNA-binding NarL/FixJ family response regulator